MDSLKKCIGVGCPFQEVDIANCTFEDCAYRSSVGNELIYWVSSGLAVEDLIGTPMDIRFKNLETALAQAKTRWLNVKKDMTEV